MKNFIVTIILLQQVVTQAHAHPHPQAEENNCTVLNCPEGFGECVNNICLCGAGYTTPTWTNNQNTNSYINTEAVEYCTYAYKYKDYAATFEGLFPFGVGHFYTKRYLHAFIKFIMFWFLSLNKIVFKKQIRLYPIINRANFFFLWVFALVYIVDYTSFSLNYYLDGYGMDLL